MQEGYRQKENLTLQEKMLGPSCLPEVPDPNLTPFFLFIIAYHLVILGLGIFLGAALF